MLRRFELDVTIDCDDEEWGIIYKEIEELVHGYLCDYIVPHLRVRFVHKVREKEDED